MQKNGKIDMTKGPILKQVTVFALPIILGNILQQLYSTVDTLVIGNFCGRISGCSRHQYSTKSIISQTWQLQALPPVLPPLQPRIKGLIISPGSKKEV